MAILTIKVNSSINLHGTRCQKKYWTIQKLRRHPQGNVWSYSDSSEIVDIITFRIDWRRKDLCIAWVEVVRSRRGHSQRAVGSRGAAIERLSIDK
jgi:hypothetical protein